MKKNFVSILTVLLVSLVACDTTKDKAKTAVNKTGEALGTGVTEFAKGLNEGLNNANEIHVELSDTLKKYGITMGKFKVEDSSANNSLSIYLIFEQDVKRTVTVKLFDRNGVEYGRVKQLITAKKDDARFVDFVFDKRSVIERKSKFVLE